MSIGGSGAETSASSLKYKDGYVIAGILQTENRTDDKAYVVKIDTSFQVKWEKIFKTSQTSIMSRFNKAIATKDGGTVLVGSEVVSIDNSSSRVFVVKLNKDGVQEWYNYYERATSSIQYNIIATLDNGYLTFGSHSTADGGFQVDMFKVDKKGNIAWYKNFENVVALPSCVQSSDSSYAFAGKSTNGTPVILSIDKTGQSKWAKVFNSTSLLFSAISVGESSNIYVTGSQYPTINGNAGLAFAKFDSNGNLIWGKSFDNRSRNISGKEVKLVGKNLLVSNLVSPDIALATFTTNGQLKSNTLYTNYDSYNTGISILSKNNLLVSGYKLNVKGSMNFYLGDMNTLYANNCTVQKAITLTESNWNIQPTSFSSIAQSGVGSQAKKDNRLKDTVNSTVTILCNSSAASVSASSFNAITKPKQSLDVSVLNNPIRNGSLVLQLKNNNSTLVNITIADVNNRTLQSKKVQTTTIAQTISFDMSSFANGLYFVSINNGSDTKNFKIVK